MIKNLLKRLSLLMVLVSLTLVAKADVIYNPNFAVYQDFVTPLSDGWKHQGTDSLVHGVLHPYNQITAESVFGFKSDTSAADFFIATNPAKWDRDVSNYSVNLDAYSKWVTLGLDWAYTHQKDNSSIVENGGDTFPRVKVWYTATKWSNASDKVITSDTLIPYKRSTEKYKWTDAGYTTGGDYYILDSIYNKQTGDTPNSWSAKGVSTENTNTTADSTWYFVVPFDSVSKVDGFIELDYGPYAQSIFGSHGKKVITATLIRNPEAYSSAYLKTLELHLLDNSDAAEFTVTADDVSRSQLDFIPSTYNYEFKTPLEKQYVIRYEPERSGTTIVVELDNKVMGDSDIKNSGAKKYITIPQKGGEVKITVTSPNGDRTVTYRINIISEFVRADPKGNDDSFEKTLFLKAYFVDGEGNQYNVNKLDINKKIIGSLDGTVAGKDTTYTLNVPDILDPSLDFKFTTYLDHTYFLNQGYRVFTEVTTNRRTWTVEIKQPKTPGTNPDPEDPTEWKPVYLELKDHDHTKESGDGRDSIAKWTISAFSNKTQVDELVLYYDSLTTTPIALDKPFSPDVHSYTASATLPASNRVYLLSKFTGKSIEYDFSPLLPRSADQATESDVRGDTLKLFSIPITWESGKIAYLKLKTKAESGDSVSYSVKFQKAIDLSLEKLTLKFNSDNGGAPFLKEYDYDPFTREYNVGGKEFANYNIVDLTKTTITSEFKDQAAYSEVIATSKLVNIKNEYVEFKYTITTVSGVVLDEYTFVLTLPTDEARLEYLSVAGYDLDPICSPDVYLYSINVGSEVNDIRIYADMLDVNASKTGDGRKSLSQLAEQRFNIVVTPPSALASATKTYTIIVYKNIETGLNAVKANVRVASNNGNVTINTNVAEKVHVYSVTGNLLQTINKQAGEVTTEINKGIVILRGTSGWVSKELIK